ncbi:hypothetical protein A7Q26_09190 [Sphingobium sp. TCM1]|nr:hypothetical protein A7Q26_09190 [Sphingobium sp. TCM1]
MFRAYYNGYELYKTFTISKARAVDGSSKYVELATSHYFFSYDANNQVVAQTTTLSLTQHNLTAAPQWRIKRVDDSVLAEGTAASLLADGSISGTANENSIEIQAPLFDKLCRRAGASAIVIEAVVSNGAEICSDRVTIYQMLRRARVAWENVDDPFGTKPDDNATEGAPPGTPVGDKTSDEVIDAITDLNGVLIRSEQIKADVDAAQAQIAAIESGFQEDLSDLNGEIDQLGESVAGVAANVTGLLSTTSGIQQSVGALQSGLSGAQSSITGISNSVTTITGQVSSLQTQANGIVTSVSNVATDLSNAVGRITNAEGEIDTIASTVGNHTSLISSNATAISNVNGDLATLRTLVRVGGNLLRNTDFTTDTSGWLFNNTGLPGAEGGRDQGGDPWRLRDEHNISIKQTNTVNNGAYAEFSQSVVVTGGNWYEFSALVAAHRCKAEIILQWLDSNGGWINPPTPTQQINTYPGGGVTLAGWFHAGVKGQAPVNAVRAILYLRKLATDQGTTDSFAWFSRPLFAQTTADATYPSAYTAGNSGAAIETQAQALRTLDGSLASLTTRVGTTESNVTQNASAISTTQGNLATLSSTVSSQGGSITSLQQSVTNINGTVSSLSSTVSSQGGSISSLQSAVSTAQGNLSTLTTRVDAGAGVNLILNGGFENGIANWTFSRPNGWSPHVSGSWGQIMYNSSLGDLGGAQHLTIDSDRVPVWGSFAHTLSFEVSLLSVSDPAARTYGEMLWYDGNDNYITTSYGPQLGSGDFTSDNSRRRALTFTATPPGGTTYARVRITVYRGNGTIGSFGVRQVKFENGPTATAFNSAASVVQQWKAYNDLNSSHASLSSTVSSQGGSISSLQSTTSNLSGTVSSLSQTVASQGSSITGLQSAVSTAQGDTATLKTQVSAGAGNLLPNTDFAVGCIGWVYYHNGNGLFNQGRNLLGDDWRPPNENVFVLAQEDANTSYYASFYIEAAIPVDTNKWYEWNAYVGPHRCSGNILVQFYDRNGTNIANHYGSGFSSISYDGRQLNGYSRPYLKMKPPAGAATARMVIEKGSTTSGNNSYVVVCRPQMKEVFESANSPAAYTVGGAGAVVSQQSQTLSTLSSSFSSLESRVSSTEGSVSSLSQTLTNANGSISSLQSNVSSLNGSVSTLQQSSSTQAGQISSLQSTVGTQGATISSNSQAITGLQGSVASLNTTITASSNPNLLQNGGFENDLRGWDKVGLAQTGWWRNIWTWGNYAANTTAFTNGYCYLSSIPVGVAENNVYTFSAEAELRSNGAAYNYLSISWENSAGQYITESNQSGPTQNQSFSTNGTARFKVTATAPSGAASARLRLITYCPANVTVTLISWRQAKFEFGSIATPYSAEATASQMFTAYSDLNSSHASLSSTVSSHSGSISTLQSTTSSLNGTVSSLSSTVSAQGSSISSLQQVQSTQSGTIATLQQRVTVGGNVLNNSEFAIGNEGWAFHSWDGNNGNFVVSRDGAGESWRPTNEHNLAINQQDSNNGRVSQWYSEQFPVIAGRWYEFSAHTASHRCYTQLRIDWYDASGNGISSDWSDRSDSFPGFYQSNGGNNLANWQRLWRKVQAPSNAARACFLFIKLGTSQEGGWNGSGDSWGWFCRPQVSEVFAETQGPTAYFPGRTSASINSQQTVINSLNGQYSSLSSTVSTQGASISSLQSTTSTLQGDTATLKTQISAGNPNLLRNGGFELGNLNYWTPVGAGFNAYGGTDTWGTYASNGSNVPDGSYTYIESNKVNIEVDYYTASADIGYFGSANGHAYVELVFWNNDTYVTQVGGAARSIGFNFSSDGYTRRLTKVTGLAPSNANRVSCRVVWYKANGTSQSMHVRQVKLERGQVATPYSAEATVRQSFEALSTLNGQYAALNSTVSTLNSSVSTQQAAINNINGRVAAWWQVDAVAGNGRAQLRVVADANGGGGVDITGDLRVTGDVLIGGTVNPEALRLDRFVKRIYNSGAGSAARGQTLLIYAQDLGYTLANGEYLLEFNGGFQTTVGNYIGSHNNKPYSRVDTADGGIRLALSKNGSEFWMTVISANEWQQINAVNMRTYSTTRTFVIDSPGGSDGGAGNVVVTAHAIQGASDTGIVDDGDNYHQFRSADYTGCSFNLKTKWTIL